MDVFIFIAIYFAVISIVAAALTVFDKAAAKRHGRRIPEATLMTVGLFGGAAVMYIVMKTIRHKTKHKKFMIGLPLELTLHAALLCLLIYFILLK